MRALLDVNVVMALLDPDHVFHEQAHVWWATNVKSGWASCPIVENGVVRIVSRPEYSRRVRFTPGDLVGRLQIFAEQTDHEFWSDDVSWRDRPLFILERIHGSQQLTDLYLLALAAKHGGRLVTFERSIPISAVPIAKVEHLCVI
ncbi:MAG: VapC toxin family PIN domain ribonuclease [Verrucomicrobia bacterium]|nr:VapC toxin family PIN domain ribonuclease [Verrucomicrobiota bacterium]